MKGLKAFLRDITPSPLNRSKAAVLEAAKEGRSLGDDETLDPEAAFEHWAVVIAARVRAKKDALILITGPTGEGKSTLAMRLALRVSELLGTRWEPPSGLAYTAGELLTFYKNAAEAHEVGRACIVDEGAQALFSGDINNPDVKSLIKAVNLVRVAGCVVFLCVPDLMSIAKSMRVRLAHLWMAVRTRGLARCHLRDRSVKYKPETNFGFSVSTKAPHIAWTPFPEDDEPWISYMRRKDENLLSYLREAVEETNGDLARRPMSHAERQRKWRAKHKHEPRKT